MATQTFPCPFCGKKMGVGVELLGRKVRCPHCNQILVAPAPTPAIVPVAAAPPAPPPTPTPPPVPDLPAFNIPSQEARESIFGEQEDESDDVFSSSNAKLRVPEMPSVDAPAEPLPPAEAPPAPVLPPSPPPESADPPTVEVVNPFAELAFEPPVAPAPASPPRPVEPVVVQPVVIPVAPPPPPVPVVAPIGATPPSSAGGNPWAGMDHLPPVPVAVPTVVPTPVLVPVPVQEESPFIAAAAKPKRRDDDEPRDDRPARRGRTPAPASGGNPLFRVGFFILAPYALIATIAAIYGLFLKSSVPAGHPLSNLPDNFGEFAPAERKKTGRLNVPLDGDLPADQKVALGGKLDIGQLHIEPVRVEERRLNIVSEGRTGGKGTFTTGLAALVLKLKVTNTSDDLLIHPLDPAFNRQTTTGEKIGTTLMIGKTAHPGGPIHWPYLERYKRQYEEAQAGDGIPLKPHESREYAVCTDAKGGLAKSVKESSDPVLWRVQVRRGRMEFDGRDIPVTAIIGVEFKPSDVKSAD